MSRKHKKVLRKNITLIMCALIGTIVVVYGVGMILFRGYVLIKMLMTDESWYVVRNTRGVTGFVGPGSKPVPLTDEEVESMGVVEMPIDIDLEVGESVRVISGPLREFVAIIQEISVEKHKIKALIDMFGRETLAELDFNQVEKLV